MLRSKLTESEKRNHTKSLNEKVSYNDKKRVKSEDVEFAFNSHIPGTNTFMIVLIILSSILLFSLFYLNFIIDNQNTQLVFNNLQDESKKNMQELSQVINSEKKVFGIMQQAIPSNKESIVRISAIMNNCLEDTSFTTLGVAGLDGQSYDSDGKTSNISGEKYFEIGKSGETRVTCLKTKDKNGYYDLVYSTPLKFKGRSVGVAYGFYDSDKFKSKLRDNSTNPETFFRIIDKEGNIIISTSMLDEVNNVKNIFEQGFEFKDAKNKDAMAKIKKDVKNDKSGVCFVKNKETEKYGFYQTANYNDWSIFTGVSKNFYETISSSILFKANIIIAIILISIIVLVGGMISHNRNRKRMMTASRKHFNYVVDGINGGVIITAMDEGFPILHASRGAEKLFGYSTNEMIGLTNRQLTYRDDAQKVYSAIEKVIREESDTVDVVYRRVKKDGSLVWVNERGKTIENEKGQRILQSVFTNVDMEKRNEINLFLKAQEYDVIVEKSELVVFSYDIMRNTITIEKKIDNCEDFPIREEFSADGISGSIKMTNEYKQIIERCFERIADGEKKIKTVIKLFDNSGAEKIVQIELFGIFDNNSKPAKVFGVATEITKQYYLEKQKGISTIIKSDIEIWLTVDVEDDKIIDGSTEWLNAIGFTHQKSYEKMLNEIVVGVIHKDDIALVQQFISTKKLKQLKADSVLTQSVDYRRIEENDAYIWVNCFVKMYNDRTTNKLMARCSLKIIDSTQKEKDLLAKKIEMDELTGVYTRNTTEKMIGEYFNLSGHKRISALIVYDVALSFQKVMQIDGDKNDDMLKKVTEKVKIIFRNDDIVGRINNNKFVVFMKNIPERTIAMTKIKMMQEAISELGFSINIGVAFSEIQNETYQNIYEIADDCRVRAKNNGKNSFVTNENN